VTSRVVSFAQAITATLQHAAPAARTVEWQLGRFDFDDLRRISARAPIAVVGIIEVPLRKSTDGNPSGDTRVAVFVVTKGQKDRREEEAWTIAEQVAVTACEPQMWGLTGLGVPTDVRIEPLASDEGDKLGAALIAVEWRQLLHRIGVGAFDADPPAPDTLIIGDADEPEIAPEVSP
jgi:hypothetical protein